MRRLSHVLQSVRVFLLLSVPPREELLNERGQDVRQKFFKRTPNRYKILFCGRGWKDFFTPKRFHSGMFNTSSSVKFFRLNTLKGNTKLPAAKPSSTNILLLISNMFFLKCRNSRRGGRVLFGTDWKQTYCSYN